MEIHLSTITEKLSNYVTNIYINKEEFAIIKSVKYLHKNITNFEPNTLYIADNSIVSLLPSELSMKNLLIVSETSINNTFITNNIFNLIIISGKCAFTIFNEVLDIFYEYQKLTDGSSKLLEALAQGNGIQPIIDAAFKLIGNPIFIRDIKFNILGYTKNVEIDDAVWNKLVSKGYQSYDAFQFLTKHKFLETINNLKIPVYFKIIPKNANITESQSLEEKELKTGLTKGMRYLLKPNFDPNNNISISRIWSNIHLNNKVFGHVVVLEAFKPFSNIDIELISKLSDVISLEFQKSIYDNSSSELKQDLFIFDILDGKINDEETLIERLKFFSHNFKNNFRIISITIEKKNLSNASLNYIKDFLNTLFPDSICILYNGYAVAILNGSAVKTIRSAQLERLSKFLVETGMKSGISRTFTDLLQIKKHYTQSVKALDMGRHLKKEEVIFFFDDYILQHMFSLCSFQEPIKELCNPSIFVLINYDLENNTSYFPTLYSYVMKFKNQSDIANELHMHRNTLYYRISKIEEIMNVDLDNIDDFVSIYISFKILEYIDER